MNITGLDSSTAYWIKVRAHVDGIGGYGNDMLWSSFSAAVNCSAGQSPKPLAPPSADVPEYPAEQMSQDEEPPLEVL